MVQGEAKLKAQLKALQNLKFDETKSAVMKKVFENSQELVPVNTGELKASGKYDQNGITYGDSQVGYANFVEFGTIHQRPQPYIRPAYENNRSELARIAANEANREIKEVIR